MKPRPIRRTLLVLLLFIIAGAIVNVAVAWGCAFWPYPRYPLHSSSPGIKEIRLWRELARPEWNPLELRAWHASSFGGTGRAVGGQSPAQCVGEMSYGWPMRATCYTYWTTGSDGGISSGVSFIPWGKLGGERYFLPVGPLWLGFVVNTIFYAAVIAVIWMLWSVPILLRRRRRFARGLCAACAYPIGTSEVCTECGAAVVPLPLHGGAGEGRGEGGAGKP